MGGTPSSPGRGGTPSSPGQGGTPSSPCQGVPQTWDGVPHQLDGVPPPEPRMGYPPDLGWGTPHPDLGQGNPPAIEVWTDKQTENSTLPHPSDAGGNELVRIRCSSVRVYTACS